MKRPSIPPEAPIFPLPNCVLFPKVFLPLRIFEPRYKDMLKAALDGQGWIAVALYRSEKELDPQGFPNIYPIAGLGRVVDYQKAADGTYKMVLLGECRVELRGWAQVKPYPVSKLAFFKETEPEPGVRDSIRVRLRTRVKDFIRKSVDAQVLTILHQTITECEEIGPLVDSIAYHFLSNVIEKQRLLEIGDAEKREQLLLDLLAREKYGEGHAGLLNQEA
ncbi:MAG: LON peptidase substrate-binding domain-containing protein [Planctomycetes bacterium]|nr:LON peptidase substrate-binding domain-containing protein [Planctomycetota bacterium]